MKSRSAAIASKHSPSILQLAGEIISSFESKVRCYPNIHMSVMQAFEEVISYTPTFSDKFGDLCGRWEECKQLQDSCTPLTLSSKGTSLFQTSAVQGYSPISLYQTPSIGSPGIAQFCTLVPTRLLRIAHRRLFSALATVQNSSRSETKNVNTCSRKEATVSAVAEYLHKVHRLPKKDADSLSRSSPTFVDELLASAMRWSLDEGNLTENPSLDMRNFQMVVLSFLEEKGMNVLELFFGKPGRSPCKVGVVLPLVQSNLTNNQDLLERLEVLENLGLSRKNVWEVIKRNPQLMKWSPAEILASVCVLEELGIDRKAMLELIEDSSVFSANLGEKIMPVLKYLDEVGIKRHLIGHLMKFNPQGVVNMPIAVFQERINFLLGLGLSVSDIERTTTGFPQLVHLRLGNLTQKIEFLDSIGIDKNSIRKIVAKFPSIFFYNIEQNITPKLELLESLGLVKSNIVKIVSQNPQYFRCSMDNLKQKLTFFESIGLTGNRLVKLLTMHPRALSISVDENLCKKLDFLIGKGFVMGSTSISRALGSCITISMDALESRLQNLVDLGFHSDDVCKLLRRQPTILGLSEKSICSKMEYLVKTMNRQAEEILKCPGYLSYSLEFRIKPRHRVITMLQSRGLLRQETYSLSTIVQVSEKKFLKRFASLHPDCAALYSGELQKLQELEPFFLQTPPQV